jgi:hypothetical protein
MRYWWVNQNQTHRQEVAGGYLWSPKRNANGGRNPFYEAMREVSPGDIVFSFVDTRIAAIGIAESYCWESPKPIEFGSAGQYWQDVGWKVRVHFTPLLNRYGPRITSASSRQCCQRGTRSTSYSHHASSFEKATTIGSSASGRSSTFAATGVIQDLRMLTG